MEKPESTVRRPRPRPRPPLPPPMELGEEDAFEILLAVDIARAQRNKALTRVLRDGGIFFGRWALAILLGHLAVNAPKMAIEETRRAVETCVATLLEMDTRLGTLKNEQCVPAQNTTERAKAALDRCTR